MRFSESLAKNTKAPCMVSHQHFPHDDRNSGFPFPDKLLQRARSEGPGQRAALSCWVVIISPCSLPPNIKNHSWVFENQLEARTFRPFVGTTCCKSETLFISYGACYEGPQNYPKPVIFEWERNWYGCPAFQKPPWKPPHILFQHLNAPERPLGPDVLPQDDSWQVENCWKLPGTGHEDLCFLSCDMQTFLSSSFLFCKLSFWAVYGIPVTPVSPHFCGNAIYSLLHSRMVKPGPERIKVTNTWRYPRGVSPIFQTNSDMFFALGTCHSLVNVCQRAIGASRGLSCEGAISCRVAKHKSPRQRGWWRFPPLSAARGWLKWQQIMTFNSSHVRYHN
jgi:hypothetical protein